MRICVGIDVAKLVHWATAIDEGGRIALDRAVENNPAAIDGFVADLRALEGELVLGTDVVGSFARFLEAVLLAEGFVLVHAPGIAVNRAGQGFAGGERKSDPRDARTIAELVRTRDLRPVLPDDDTRVALRLKAGRRTELIIDQTRRLNRLHGLLGGIHPGLEQVLDLTNLGPLALLTRYVTPSELRRAGRARLTSHLGKTPRVARPDRLVATVLDVARAQRIIVPGEAATAELVRELAAEALAAKRRIAQIERDLEALLADHPNAAVIRSLPGMGVVLTAEFLAHVGDIRRFHSADALAASAGLAPVMRQSGRKLGWRRAYGGDKALKRVLFQCAFCAVRTKDPASKAFYDRKRREGKHHTQALIALARRRTTVLWAMIQQRRTYEPLQKAA